MKNKFACIVLCITQGIYVIYLGVWLLSVFFTIILLPENEQDTTASPGVFYSIAIYPLALLLSVIGSWMFYHKSKFKLSYLLNAIPLLWVIPMTLFAILLIAWIMSN